MARLDGLGARQDDVNVRQEELSARQAKVDVRHEELIAWQAKVDMRHEELIARQDEANTQHNMLIARQEETIRHQDELNARQDSLSLRQDDLNGRQVELAADVERLPILEAHVTQLEEGIGRLGNIREMLPLLNKLEQELELRQAEEVRLFNLYGTHDDRLNSLIASLEEEKQVHGQMTTRVSEIDRTLEEVRLTLQDLNDNWKPALSELNRRVAPLTERLSGLSNTIMKTETGLQTLTGDQTELRESITNLTTDLQRAQTDIARQFEAWQAALDENKDNVERFAQQWITLSNQYKEARMAVQNFAHWQKQLEQQKREASEMLRVESNRMQSRWDGFLLEIQEKLKNFELELNQKWQAYEIESEQKWSGVRRSEQLWREELATVDDLIQKLQQDNRNLIWRVQAAQADAIKKWPRLLMEEVEKAVELNPSRRLTSTAAPLRSDMSVVDAIEQGLITIDYNDDAAIEL
jgi:chromosome segregation ATPase